MRQALITERLVLRDVNLEDAPLLVALDSDPEVMRYIGTTVDASLEFYEHRIGEVFLAWQSHPWQGIRMVECRTTGGFLGWVFVRPAKASRMAAGLGWSALDAVELGYRYHRFAWGQGIATEAARALLQLAIDDRNGHDIVACASAANRGSLRVLEKLGFVPEEEVLLEDEAVATVKLRYVAPQAGD